MTNLRPTGPRGKTPIEASDSSRACSPKRIQVSDKDGTLTPLFPADETTTTGAEVGWRGLLIEQHHLKPLEFPERTADSHLIAMHLRPATLEWFLGGQPQTRRMRRGSLDIVPQGTLLGGYSKDETEFLMLALDPLLIEQVARENGTANHFELTLHLGVRDPQIEHITLALKAELNLGHPSGRLYCEALAIALSARLLRKYSSHIPVNHNHNTSLPDYKLRRVIAYINDNLTEELTLAELANVAAMSPHYFSRAFRQSTGMPPHRYVMKSRIEMAKRLLTDENLPLVEVGLGVGFQNQSHFTTLFHKVTGVTPKAYRDGI